MKKTSLLPILILFGFGCQSSGASGETTSQKGDLEGDSLSSSYSPEFASDPKLTVLDYYRQLKDDYDPGYPLRQKGGKWVTVSPLSEQDIDATVDLKNGFIEVIDEGTGDGMVKVQVALFRLADGKAVVAISKQIFDGIGAQQSWHFLRPDAAGFKDWTEHTMPIVTGFDFLPDDYAEEPDVVEEALPVLIELPRHGTNLVVSVFTEKKGLYCSEQATEYQRDVLCPVFGRLTRTTFSLKWDKTEGRFL